MGKLNAKELLRKIEQITQARIAKDSVVSLSDYRSIKNKPAPETLLIVEDDETMRLALKRIFEGEGYRVLTAADGTGLSQVLDDTGLDMIILDVGLPWINGYELAELMKAHEELKNIPLIFISGRTGEAEIKRGFAVGADDFITKPFDVEKIKKTVRTLLRLSRSAAR